MFSRNPAVLSSISCIIKMVNMGYTVQFDGDIFLNNDKEFG
jgi:hypothetical protein